MSLQPSAVRLQRFAAAAGVSAALVVALGSCTPAGPAPGTRAPTRRPPVAAPAPAPTQPAPAPGPVPTGGGVVRVGLAVDADSVIVSGTGGAAAFVVVASNGDVLYRGGESDRLVVRHDGGLRARTPDGRSVSLPELATVRPAPGSVGYVMIDNAQYRGAVLLRSSAGGGVTAVNTLDMETYLLGVVPREIPVTQFEAVKAQAVAARTYAVGQMGRRESLGFDFYASVQDQVYGGIGAENDIATRAVAETAGEILTYDGEPIDAFYHSTCGGRTAAIEEVWNSGPVPYLRSVSDEKPGGGAWCDTSSRYRWTQAWTRDQLRTVLATNLAGRGARGVETVEGIEIDEESRSGRAAWAVVTVDGDDYRVRGDSIRWILRKPDNTLLNSSLLLDIEETRTGDEITALEVHGGGWGHGIGMCQVGAMNRAAAGHSYRDILAAYYQGATLTRIY